VISRTIGWKNNNWNLGDTRFESRPDYRLLWLRFLVVSLIHLR